MQQRVRPEVVREVGDQLRAEGKRSKAVRNSYTETYCEERQKTQDPPEEKK